jgi:formate dehydrogenase subunit gamma
MTSTPTSSSARPETVERFKPTERWLHWAFTLPLLVAFVSGLSLILPGAEKLFGSREAVRVAHWFGGFGSLLLPLVVLALGDRRRLAADAQELDLWSAGDRAWLRTWLGRRTGGRGELPPAGRFNAGQKANAVITAAALLWLGLSGLALFPALHTPFWLVENSRALHNLTWILLVPVIAGHIFLSALYRPTRPGLPGVFTGRVPRSWVREHHPLDEISLS